MNTVSITFTYVPGQALIPDDDVENPPVLMVAMAWQAASNASIGPAQSSRNSSTVRHVYIPHICLAVDDMRGRILSWVMPVASALNICMPPEWFSMGITARVKMMIPMPPSHWLMHRHTLMVRLSWSVCSTSDTPVVVNPLMASKKAADRSRRVVGASIYGIMPNSENTTHIDAVSRKPSRRPMSVWVGRILQNTAPAAAVMAVEMPKARMAPFSPHIMAVTAGASMNAASISRRKPVTRTTIG